MLDNLLKSNWISGIILFCLSAILIVSAIALASDVYFNLYGAVIGIKNGHDIAEYDLIFLLAGLKSIIVLLLAYLIFNVLSMLDALYTYNVYKAAASEYEIKEFDIKEILQKTLRWAFFKAGYILAPHLILIFIVAVLVITGFMFFNYFADLAGYSIGLATFISVFSLLLMFFLFATAAVISTWRHITTFFGYECAVSEPALPNVKIIRRSEKLFFSNPANAIFYLLNNLYIAIVLFQIYKYVTFPGFVALEHFPAIFAAIALNFLFLGVYKYFKAKMYVASLLKYYDKISFKKEKFEPIFQKLYVGNDRYKFVE